MAAPNIEESVTHTRSVMNRLKHTWIIDNFSNLYVPNADESTEPEYPRIVSKSFNCSQEKRIQFAITLNPKGVNEESKDYISVYLDLAFKEAAKVPIKFKLSILNDRNQKKYSRDGHLVFTKSAGRGWHKFVERSVLLDQNNGYLANDQLTILCEIEMYSEPVAELAIDTCLEDLKSQSITKNSEMYGNLLKSGDQSDVVLVVHGDELKAHKIILSAHSPVFKAMFECDMKERAEGRVVIDDLTFEVATELLNFIYTGSVELLNSSAEELLTAADKYGLDMLKQICGQYLVGKVATDSAARLLALADAHSAYKLKRTCMEYIRGHLVEVMLTEDWPLVSELIIDELYQEEFPQEDDDEMEDDEEETAVKSESTN